MRPGLVIGFRDKKDLALACVTEVTADKVRLLTERGKEFTFPADKVLIETGRVTSAARRDDCLTALATARARIDELRVEIQLHDLWELLRGGEASFTLHQMAGDYFGPDATGDHRAAMLSELLLDSVYFKQKADEFVPRPEEQVREIQRQKEVEERRDRERSQVITWFRGLLGETDQEAPAGADRFIGLVKQYVLAADGATENGEAVALLKEVGISESAGAFDLLVRAGIWKEDENLLLHRYQVPDHFTREVQEQTELLAERCQTIDYVAQPGRVDLTGLECFTVDDPDTMDIDDALSIETIDGGYRVGIHIADVGEFVQDSDVIDSEAFRRGLTIYLPERKIQMLPDRISLELASLVAGSVHPAVSVMVDLDANGTVLASDVCLSAVRVRSRLSYDDVDQLLANDTPWTTMLALAQKLRHQRIEAGALVFNVPDVKIRVDGDGSLSVRKVQSDTPSHLIVSEMMILANRLVADWLIERKVPAIFRLQAAPDEPISLVGYEAVTFYRIRRSIKRTEVALAAKPHSGLGIKAYVQMTSPIRRYGDLATHRQIRSMLATGKPAYSEEDMRSVMNSTERAQEVAALVQKDSHRYWLVKHLRNLVGLTVPGLVLDRRDESYVVQLTDYLLEVSVYQRPENRYETGEAIFVKIVEAEPRRGYIKCQDAGRAGLI